MGSNLPLRKLPVVRSGYALTIGHSFSTFGAWGKLPVLKFVPSYTGFLGLLTDELRLGTV